MAKAARASGLALGLEAVGAQETAVTLELDRLAAVAAGSLHQRLQ